ncbi:MAG: T9SS type A sorting domain-containing protein [Pedobacter sp.]|nr:MAG: T9SS type A sorting domain-containing protein [Pedobacter sp.]
MEKLYKLIVLFVGLTVMNLTVQAQVNSYSLFLATGIYHGNLTTAKDIVKNHNSDYHWGDFLVKPRTKQVTGFTNYPNPATTFTTVGYTLATKSNVVLKVIDLAGKQLALLIKQEQLAGKQEFYWELSKNNISPGMYILILQVESKTYSRKIIVQ